MARFFQPLAAFSTLALLTLAAAGAVAPLPPYPSVGLVPSDRILVLAPHPDDEVLGCGAVIREAVRLELPLRVVFLTHGDNNEWSFALYRKHPVLLPGSIVAMGEIRRREALEAARALGVDTNRLVFLGYPDYRTMAIWLRHWGVEPPCPGMLSRSVKVPYPDALRPGAPHKGEEIVRDLAGLLRDLRPTKVFVSHPADFNFDHRALYLFTRVALWQTDLQPAPELFPYLVHYPRWPFPHGLNFNEPMRPPPDLASPIPWRQAVLAVEDDPRLLLAIERHRSQFMYSRSYLLSFMRPNALFGDFPILKPDPGGGLAVESPSDHADEYQDLLTESEQERFIGLVERSMFLGTNMLVIRIRYSGHLSAAASLSVRAFGYRKDYPFEKMPKLRIETGTLFTGIYNQSAELPLASCRVTRRPREVEIRIPLALLGWPDHILTDSVSQLGLLSLDRMPWRIIDVPPHAKGPPP